MKLTRILLAGCLIAGLTGTFVAFADEDAPPEHKQWMKDLGAANGEIRKGVNIEANANKMAALSLEVERWWAKRTSDVAVKTSREMAAAAKKIADLSKSDDRQALAAASKELAASCRGCHDVHRVKISDTEYKIK